MNGITDMTFGYCNLAGDIPVVGDWNGKYYEKRWGKKSPNDFFMYFRNLITQSRVPAMGYFALTVQHWFMIKIVGKSTCHISTFFRCFDLFSIDLSLFS